MNEEQAREKQHQRQRASEALMQAERTCSFCYNSGVVEAKDQKGYIFAFRCQNCKSADIRELSFKDFVVWDERKYPGLTRLLAPGDRQQP